MPEQFYGSSMKQSGIHQPEKQQSFPPSSKKKKGKIFPVIVIVVLLGLLVFSGWLLYESYFKQPAVIISVEEEKPIVEEEIIPVEEPIVPEEIVEELEQVEIPIEPVINEPEIKSLAMMLGVDSDQDGLTDDEELLIKTDPAKPDTDADGFLDGQEVVGLYNPLAVEPTKIEFSGIVTTYVNPTYDYDIFYPQNWLAKALDKANLEIMFTSTLGEFVDVLVQENPGQLDVKSWYKTQAPEVADESLVVFTNKNGLSGLFSPDGFTVYFAKNNFVYVIQYNIGLKEQASYPNLFKMMYESFVFTGENGS
jgi:hypothetical protein